jgi:hypothetical protein
VTLNQATIRAVRLLRRRSEPELATVPVPEPGPGEVLLKVEAGRAWYPTALPVAAVLRSWRIGSAPGFCRSASPRCSCWLAFRRGEARRSAVNGVEDGGELCGCTDHCHVTGVEIDDVRPEQRNGSLLEFLDVTLVPGEVHVRPGDLALVAA